MSASLRSGGVRDNFPVGDSIHGFICLTWVLGSGDLRLMSQALGV